MRLPLRAMLLAGALAGCSATAPPKTASESSHTLGSAGSAVKVVHFSASW